MELLRSLGRGVRHLWDGYSVAPRGAGSVLIGSTSPLPQSIGVIAGFPGGRVTETVVAFSAQDRNEGSPPATIRPGRHDVGFATHMATLNELEHATARSSEDRGQADELEQLLARWLAAHRHEYSPAGDAALIPDTMRALGVSSPLWHAGGWIDGDAR